MTSTGALTTMPPTAGIAANKPGANANNLKYVFIPFSLMRMRYDSVGRAEVGPSGASPGDTQDLGHKKNRFIINHLYSPLPGRMQKAVKISDRGFPRLNGLIRHDNVTNSISYVTRSWGPVRSRL